ncbi:MAG TPA: hypothetical protein VMV78_04965 [Thiobacillus sp.]|nr:hypothetical protein [Thiobacillus sp.]
MMSAKTKQDRAVFSGPQPIGEIFRTEWKWWLSGAILSFVLASVLMTGWPGGLIPNLAYPFTYHGDGLSHSWMLQRVIEGWIFDNPRSGFPFGSSFLDYPGSDSANYLVLKLLGLLTGEYPAAFNLYFLLGFAVSFIASFCVLRAFRLEVPFAFAAATIFVFLPFHFLRLEHLFYTWYFVVPIFFYVAFSIFYFPREGEGRREWGVVNLIGCFIGLVVLASFGVYYALFGVIVVGTAGFTGWVRSGKSGGFWRAMAVSLIVIIGVLLNIGPNLINSRVNGANAEVAARSPVDAEVYGLKMMQLLLPRLSHREERFAALTHQYSNAYPLVNENSTATLGVVGGVGFLLLGLVFLINLAGGKVDSRLALLTGLVFVLFLFGTIGGLGALFSLIISSSIRGWNRISIFIGFGSITAFFLVFQIYLTRFFSPSRSKPIILIASLAVMAVGIYDQTVPACQSCNEQTKAAFEMDKNFVQKIERLLPPSAAIYQLPYMAFPEIPPLHRMNAYDLMPGFLHSRSLRWSYAGMKGREGDLFFRSLAQQPIAKQIEVIRKLGFSGIYLDRRGFADDGRAVQDELNRILSSGPVLTRGDGEVVFYRISPTRPASEVGMNAREIMRLAGYVPAKLQAAGEALAALPRQVGQIRNGHLQSDGRTGFLLFGPYASMGAGVYQLVVNGTAATPNGAFVDVVSGGGTVKHFMAPLAAPKDDVLAVGVFQLDAPVKDLEIRVFVTQQDRVELGGYEMRDLKGN